MNQFRVDYSRYNNDWYKKEISASKYKQICWYFTNLLFFANGWFPVVGFKIWILRKFGARIGKEVVIKPGVSIKYPWKLRIGNHCWIGENVWIDNLTLVSLGENVCLSQGAMLLTGNHDYKRSTFDLIIGEIELQDGVWIGAGAMVCPGIICKSHSVLTAASVASKNLEAYSIYQGNPAVKCRERIIQS